MKRTAIALVAGLALLAGPAAAHEIVLGPTEILQLDATATSDETVAVTGDVVFGGEEPKVLAEDAAEDNLGGPATAPLGTDLLQARISWPTPEADELMFELVVSDLPPVSDGTYETLQYNWDIFVGDGDGDGTNWSIKVMRSSLYLTQTTDAYAGLYRCVQGDASFECSEVHRFEEVEFETEDGESRIRVFVPPNTIEAGPGSTISSWARSSNAIWIGASASGRLTATNIFDTINWHDDYVVPEGKTVLLGAAPQGDEIVHDTAATVADDDTFSGTVDLPGPGTYDVGGLACFSDNCGTATVTVQVGTTTSGGLVQ